jgi:hypothetical protein
VERVEARLAALDREWCAERVLEAHLSLLSAVGLALGCARNRRWLILPGLSALALSVHALRGNRGLTEWMQRAGFRSSREIEAQRAELRDLLERGKTSLGPPWDLRTAEAPGIDSSSDRFQDSTARSAEPRATESPKRPGRWYRRRWFWIPVLVVADRRGSPPALTPRHPRTRSASARSGFDARSRSPSTCAACHLCCPT